MGAPFTTANRAPDTSGHPAGRLYRDARARAAEVAHELREGAKHTLRDVDMRPVALLKPRLLPSVQPRLRPVQLVGRGFPPGRQHAVLGRFLLVAGQKLPEQVARISFRLEIFPRPFSELLIDLLLRIARVTGHNMQVAFRLMRNPWGRAPCTLR